MYMNYMRIHDCWGVIIPNHYASYKTFFNSAIYI